MSEKIARFKQFEYRATSNLVLMAERTGSRVNEPTGEPERYNVIVMKWRFQYFRLLIYNYVVYGER